MESPSLRNYGAAAPHGPNMTGRHTATAEVDIRHDMSENEASVFHALLHPDDIYDENGVYWADLPIVKRLKFVANVDGQEAKKEMSSILSMAKADPLSPVAYYFRNMVLPGAGLLLEGSVCFLYFFGFSFSIHTD